MPKPKDGVSPDPKAIAEAAAKLIRTPKDGVSPSAEEVARKMPTPQRGKTGAPGKNGVSITDVKLNDNVLFVWLDGKKKKAGSLKIPAASAPFNPGNAGGGGSARQTRNDTGYCVYAGDDYTEGSPLVLAAGVTEKLLNNGATNQILTQCPLGGTLYDPTIGRITPNSSGDAFTLRVSLKAFTTSNNGGFSIAVDISENGDGSVIIGSKPVRMLRGTGEGNTDTYTVDLSLFSGPDFLANGAPF
jgi:hypothetical protein